MNSDQPCRFSLLLDKDAKEAFRVLDLVQSSVIVRSPDGVIGYWNHASTQLYGIPDQQVLGRSMHDVFDAASFETCSKPTCWLANDHWQGETVRPHCSGQPITLTVYCSLERDAHGIALYVVETAFESNPQTVSRLTLERSEYRYRSMFNAMAASFWELDISAVGVMIRELHVAGGYDVPAYLRSHPQLVREMMCSTRVVDVNELTPCLFGRGDKQEILAATIEVFWPAASVGVYADAVCSALAGDCSFVRGSRLRRIDGSELDALFTCAFPPDKLAKRLLMTGVLDLSASNEAFAALERMRSEFTHSAQVSMLGELMASIAHEVNQPLAAIRTNGEASMRWLALPQPNVEEVRLLAERMANDAQRASTIISDIRLMAQHNPAELSWYSVGNLIQETLSFLHSEIHARGVKTMVKLAAQHAQAHIDRSQMQQVLVNVILNAVQAMTGVETTRKELSICTLFVGDLLQITVSGNGPNIAPEHLDRLFDSFFTTKSTGTGMGLPICHSTIESFDATIKVENKSTGGACFVIVIAAKDTDHDA